MELRNILSRDLFSDHELLAVFSYCLADAQQTPAFPLVDGKVVELEPCEILIDWERMARELRMERQDFLGKLSILQEMRKLSFRDYQHFCRVLVKVKFPLSGAEELQKPKDDCIPIKLDRWIEIDLEQIKVSGFSKDYQAMVRQVLNRFKNIVGNKFLTEIIVSDLKEYLRVLREGGATNSSLNNYRRALVASFNRAIKGSYLKSNVVESEKPLPVSRTKPKIVEREDLEALLENIDDLPIRNVIEFALLSTKRHGEILNLKWADIDFENKVIQIHSSAEYRVKFNKEQDLPLSDPLEKLLKRIEHDQRSSGTESDYVFLDENGKHLREKKVQQTIKEARELAGLDNHITMHAMRRTASTMLRQKRVSTNTIKGLLNHESEKTTTRYLSSPRDDEADALNKLSLRDFLP